MHKFLNVDLFAFRDEWRQEYPVLNNYFEQANLFHLDLSSSLKL